MANLKQQKKDWKSLVAKGMDPHWFALIKLLKEQLDSDSEVFDLLIQKEANLRQLKKNINLGTIRDNEKEIQHNQLSVDLVTIISQITENDFGGNASSSDQKNRFNPLNDLLSKLQPKGPFTRLKQLNCDRVDRTEDFFTLIEDWEDQNRLCQIYTILSCSFQVPKGFSERMIYEWMEEISEDSNANIDFPRRIDGSLKIHTLEKTHRLRPLKKELKQVFTERFHTADLSLEDYIQQKFVDAKYQYIVFPLEIHEINWRQEIIKEVCDWLESLFGVSRKGGPKCIFFLIIDMDKAHLPSGNALEKFKSIESFHKDRDEQLGFLYPFNEVDVGFLRAWLNQNFDDIQPDEINALLEAFAKSLEKEDQEKYQNGKMDMLRIMRLQKKIADYYNKETVQA
jgi:hypothetical protein